MGWAKKLPAIRRDMAFLSQDQPRFLLQKVEDQNLLFGARKVFYHWPLFKVVLEIAGFCQLQQQ